MFKFWLHLFQILSYNFYLMSDVIASLRNGRPITPKVNNNIATLKSVKHLRLVRFDLDSPRMTEAMRNLGLIKEDLNCKKTRDDFPSEDTRITELHFNYYQNRLLETINSLLIERKKVKNSGAF